MIRDCANQSKTQDDARHALRVHVHSLCRDVPVKFRQLLFKMRQRHVLLRRLDLLTSQHSDICKTVSAGRSQHDTGLIRFSIRLQHSQVQTTVLPSRCVSAETAQLELPDSCCCNHPTPNSLSLTTVQTGTRLLWVVICVCLQARQNYELSIDRE